MRIAIMLLFVLVIGSLFAMSIFSQQETPVPGPKDESPAPGSQSLVVGGGCFWCLEPLFEMVKGVSAVEVGYAGGARPNPTYEQVCMGTSGHAEVVRVTFDSKEVSAEDLLRIFFTIHDPTTKDQQGPDYGPQYRSAVFYATPEEKVRAEKIIEEIESKKIWSKPIVTTIEALKNYTRAEDYHQDYYRKYAEASPGDQAKMNSGYCRAIIEPKVKKFREKFAHLLRG